MSDKLKVLINEEVIEEKVKELAKQIEKDFAGETVKFVCILKGASIFACELAKRTNLDVYLDFMSISSYGNEDKSSGIVRIVKDLDESVRNQNVIIVEDIIDSGMTVAYLSKLLEERGARSVSVCTLLNKPSRREKAVNIDYLGFEIDNEFVVGYGLDYAQKYRTLPYIASIDTSK